MDGARIYYDSCYEARRHDADLFEQTQSLDLNIRQFFNNNLEEVIN